MRRGDPAEAEPPSSRRIEVGGRPPQRGAGVVQVVRARRRARPARRRRRRPRHSKKNRINKVARDIGASTRRRHQRTVNGGGRPAAAVPAAAPPAAPGRRAACRRSAGYKGDAAVPRAGGRKDAKPSARRSACARGGGDSGDARHVVPAGGACTRAEGLRRPQPTCSTGDTRATPPRRAAVARHPAWQRWTPARPISASTTAAVEAAVAYAPHGTRRMQTQGSAEEGEEGEEGGALRRRRRRRRSGGGAEGLWPHLGASITGYGRLRDATGYVGDMDCEAAPNNQVRRLLRRRVEAAVAAARGPAEGGGGRASRRRRASDCTSVLEKLHRLLRRHQESRQIYAQDQHGGYPPRLLRHGGGGGVRTRATWPRRGQGAKGLARRRRWGGGGGGGGGRAQAAPSRKPHRLHGRLREERQIQAMDQAVAKRNSASTTRRSRRRWRTRAIWPRRALRRARPAGAGVRTRARSRAGARARVGGEQQRAKSCRSSPSK